MKSKIYDMMYPLINNGSGTYEVNDLNVYIDKIVENGCIYSIIEKDILLGFLAGYANDYENNTGFLSMLIVSPSARRMGYGRRLTDFFLTDLVHKGFDRCRTEVKEGNTLALNICKKTGFYELGKNGKYIVLEKMLT